LNSIENRREDELANLDANLQAQLDKEGLTAEQKTKIEEQFAQQKYNVQVKAFAQEEKIKKAQFLRDIRLYNWHKLAMDTASAIVKGIAQILGLLHHPARYCSHCLSWNHWSHTSLGNCKSAISIRHSSNSSSVRSWRISWKFDRRECIIIHSQHKYSDN
jgi:hypothetical protein